VIDSCTPEDSGRFQSHGSAGSRRSATRWAQEARPVGLGGGTVVQEPTACRPHEKEKESRCRTRASSRRSAVRVDANSSAPPSSGGVACQSLRGPPALATWNDDAE
jgi:hypothetical protein